MSFLRIKIPVSVRQNYPAILSGSSDCGSIFRILLKHTAIKFCSAVQRAGVVEIQRIFIGGQVQLRRIETGLYPHYVQRQIKEQIIGEIFVLRPDQFFIQFRILSDPALTEIAYHRYSGHIDCKSGTVMISDFHVLGVIRDEYDPLYFRIRHGKSE